MMNNITRPLLEEKGIEALRRLVIDTEYQIDRGVLQNTREVEVTLITSARVSSQFCPSFTTYLTNGSSVEL